MAHLEEDLRQVVKFMNRLPLVGEGGRGYSIHRILIILERIIDFMIAGRAVCGLYGRAVGVWRRIRN